VAEKTLSERITSVGMTPLEAEGYAKLIDKIMTLEQALADERTARERADRPNKCSVN